MDFIVVTSPGQRASAKTNRRVHAHAARVAHARTRRRHMAEYNQVKANIQQRGMHCPIRNKAATITIPAESQSPLPPIPRTVAGDLQPDGISRFRQNLSPLEHFIFDHCRSIQGNYLIPEFTKTSRRYPNCPTRTNLLLSHSHGLKRESYRHTKSLDVFYI